MNNKKSYTKQRKGNNSAFEKYLVKGFGNKANHKYFKRIPNPHFSGKNNRYIYFYNQAQYDQYKKTGEIPKQEKEKESEGQEVRKQIIDNLKEGNTVILNSNNPEYEPLIIMPMGKMDFENGAKFISTNGRSWADIRDLNKEMWDTALKAIEEKVKNGEMKIDTKRVKQEVESEKLDEINKRLDNYKSDGTDLITDMARKLNLTPGILSKMVYEKYYHKDKDLADMFKLNSISYGYSDYKPVVEYSVLREAGYISNNEPTEKMKKLNEIVEKIGKIADKGEVEIGEYKPNKRVKFEKIKGGDDPKVVNIDGVKYYGTPHLLMEQNEGEKNIQYDEIDGSEIKKYFTKEYLEKNNSGYEFEKPTAMTIRNNPIGRNEKQMLIFKFGKNEMYIDKNTYDYIKKKYPNAVIVPSNQFKNTDEPQSGLYFILNKQGGNIIGVGMSSAY